MASCIVYLWYVIANKLPNIRNSLVAEIRAVKKDASLLETYLNAIFLAYSFAKKKTQDLRPNALVRSGSNMYVTNETN